jgi:hypothetical protein
LLWFQQRGPELVLFLVTSKATRATPVFGFSKLFD